MNDFAAGLRLQLALFRRNPAQLMILSTIPFFSAIFLSGIKAVGRDDLASYAILGPALIGLWACSLDLGGSIIDNERLQQTFELNAIAPAGFSRVLAGRIATITLLGLVTFAESLGMATTVFGLTVHVSHPFVLVVTLVATALAMAGTCTAMAAIFVAARSARRFANALGYPFYLLGGVVVPVSYLPIWLRPLSWITYLYWSSGLLRSSLAPAAVGNEVGRLVMILVLGGAAYFLGMRLTLRLIGRLRLEGTIGLS